MERSSEIWKRIKGFNGTYEISSMGRVRRAFLNGKRVNRLLKSEKVHKGKKGARGSVARRVTLTYKDETKNCSVQRLMYETFIGKVPKDKYVTLLDKNKPLAIDNLIIINEPYNLDFLLDRTCAKGHPLTTNNYYESIYKRTGEKRCKVCHRAIVADQRRRGVIK